MSKYWSTTGCFPQEIIINLGRKINISRITIGSNRAKSIEISYNNDDKPMNWTSLGILNFKDNSDSYQNEFLDLNDSVLIYLLNRLKYHF